MSFPVAVQVYSVRDDAKADLRATLTQIKEMGYDGVELAGLYGLSASEIKSICGEVGLVPISAHVAYAAMLADPQGVLATYAEIGCKYVAIPSLPPEVRPGAERFSEALANIAMLGKVARELGLTLLYHNHDFEFIKLDGKYGLDIMYDEVPAEYLQSELDMCWVNVGGEDPASFLLKYTGRAPVVHLKDFWGEKTENMYELIGAENKAPARPEGFEFRPVGYGLQDFPSILAAAKQAGAEWVIVEQDRPSMGLTPIESINKSIDYIKTINN